MYAELGRHAGRDAARRPTKHLREAGAGADGAGGGAGPSATSPAAAFMRTSPACLPQGLTCPSIEKAAVCARRPSSTLHRKRWATFPSGTCSTPSTWAWACAWSSWPATRAGRLAVLRPEGSGRGCVHPGRGWTAAGRRRRAMLKVAVLVSGGGTNLQAHSGRQGRGGAAPCADRAGAVSSRPGVVALGRACKGGCARAVWLRAKSMPTARHYDAALLAVLREHRHPAWWCWRASCPSWARAVIAAYPEPHPERAPQPDPQLLRGGLCTACGSMRRRWQRA